MAEDLDPVERIVLACVRHVRELLRSNTFWLCLAWMFWEFSRNLDPAWLAHHDLIRTWTPPCAAAIGVAVKVLQQLGDRRDDRH